MFIDQKKGERGTQGKADHNYPATIYRLKTNEKDNNHKEADKTTTNNNHKEADKTSNDHKEADKTPNNHKKADKTSNNNKKADRRANLWKSSATCSE